MIDINMLAKKCNISTSAAYKALYNKRGVDARTRERVFAAAEGEELPIAKTGGKPSVGVVLPTNPLYYWDALYRGIRDAAPQNTHFAFFSSLGSGREGIYALDYIRNTDVCIIAPSHTPIAQARMAALAVEKPLIYVSEGVDTPQLATVCGNYFADGERLGAAYMRKFPQKPRILALHTYNGLGAQTRTNGFYQSVCARGAQLVGNIEIETVDAPLASVIARAIKAEFIGKFDCLYCATGVTPYACLALKKLRIDHEVCCIGYENPPGNAPYIHSGVLALLAVSDAYEMGRTAAHTATAFLEHGTRPATKQLYVPSKILVRHTD